MISISVDGDDFAVLYRKVRAFDVELGKSLRKRLTAAAIPVRDDVRAAALSLPSSGSGVSSVGQGIAAATEIKVNPSSPGHFSVRVRVSGSKFAAKTGKPVNLPRYVEGASTRPWRHPVYGNRNNWVSQQSHPYLVPTAARHKPAVETAVKRALQDAVDTVLNSRL